MTCSENIVLSETRFGSSSQILSVLISSGLYGWLISITDQMPEVNFSSHCWDPATPAHPNLYKCPKIEEGIKACQKAGKKILISLGGATGNNDLRDDQAKVLAKNLWDLFLGGQGMPNIRPFGR